MLRCLEMFALKVGYKSLNREPIHHTLAGSDIVMSRQGASSTFHYHCPSQAVTIVRFKATLLSILL